MSPVADDGRSRWRRVVLECSLRPFAPFDRATIAAAADRLVTQWRPLLDAADSSAVMLWASDGSELLEWAGDLDTELEWACWVGFNNADADPYGHNVTTDRWAVPYRPDMPPLTYDGIRAVVSALREALLEATGGPVEIGATFDAGPEFAPSRFKYHTHPEILATTEASGLARVIRMVRPWSILHGDSIEYAAFPEGIPEGLGFGTFFGRQAAEYLPAMGFDYLWFSNGFGFSSYAWTTVGELFDGERFRIERGTALTESILGFWQDFGRECNLPVEVRGTNFPAGLDAVVDGVPGQQLYEAGYFRMPPPNSPWGPLNRDFGIELTGMLSRIATLPGEGFPFRFYAHDPWFWQNPWRDFYGRHPYDINLPLSLSRVDRSGAVQCPSDIMVLTVDDERGHLDARDAMEIQAAVTTARAAAPDAAGPLVWLYPFREYHDSDRPQQVFDEEWVFTSAVNAGLPLSSVISTDAAPDALNAGVLDDCVVVTPGTTALRRPELIEQLRKRGIDVLVYAVDDVVEPTIWETAAQPGPGRLVEVSTRSPVASINLDEHGLRTPVLVRGADCPGRTLVAALGRFGIRMSWRTPGGGDEGPVVTLSRRGGGLRLASYVPDETLRIGLRLPQGAPVLSSHEIYYDGSVSWLTPGRSFSAECRVLIDQTAAGVVSLRELAPEPYGRSRRIEVLGLADATVTLLREGDVPVECSTEDARWMESPEAATVVVEGVSGSIQFSW